MYRVVRRFTDLQDGGRPYEVGSRYPRTGVKVTKERLEELSSDRNRRGVALIINETPEKASPEAEKGIGEAETGVNPPKTSEAKEKPRKGQRKNA